jgi:hypothetical protein
MCLDVALEEPTKQKKDEDYSKKGETAKSEGTVQCLVTS